MTDSRKKEIVTVPMSWGGRDAGKKFLITEMHAGPAEKWAYRAFLALANSGERIPDDVRGMGMVGIAILGLNIFLKGSIKFNDLEPLLDEMMTCVQAIRDVKKPNVATELVTEDDIQEVSTRAWLRSEVLRIHTGFSAADALLKLISTVMASAPSNSSITSTSPR